MPEEGKNPTMREPKDSLGHGWGFAWPKDTRIIYNRASARPDGTPWSEEKKFMWWDPEKTRVDQQGHQRSRGLSDLSACDTAGSQPALLLPVSGKYPSTSPTSRSCNPAMS